jgi:membrane protease subunit HflC
VKNKFTTSLLVAAALLLVLLYESVFIVEEGMQAVRIELGKAIEPAHTEAGWYLKKPFVQRVQYFQKRVLTWDGTPTEVPTKEKRNIIIDTTARWRITNPIRFFETLRDESLALSRIRSWIDSATREVISSHNLVEAVRSSNAILKDVPAERAETEDLQLDANEPIAQTSATDDVEIAADLEQIQVGRKEISKKIIELSKSSMAPFGIEMLDVQIKRVSLTKEVEDQVFNRMITERRRIAEKLRSEGKGERARILGLMDRELLEIQSEAYKRVQELKGTAEATSTKIYAAAFSKDPEFYEFYRTIQAYRNGLRDDARLVLSGDADFLKLLNRGSTPKSGVNQER